MRIAVITPQYRTPPSWLAQCRQSVVEQTVPCTHIVINDGDRGPGLAAAPDLQVIHLPQAHGDGGNAARAIGSVSAVCQGFDALAYLDSDNWYEPNHLESLIELHERTGAAVCTSARNLYGIDGSFFGLCPGVDGDRFVDTNCLFITRAAFSVTSAWYTMPPAMIAVCDRFVWAKVKELGYSRAHSPLPTVAYRTQHRIVYERFGLPPPPEVKDIIWDKEQKRYRVVMISTTPAAANPAAAAEIFG